MGTENEQESHILYQLSGSQPLGPILMT